MKRREEAWKKVVDDGFGRICKNAPPLAIHSKVMDGQFYTDAIKKMMTDRRCCIKLDGFSLIDVYIQHGLYHIGGYTSI